MCALACTACDAASVAVNSTNYGTFSGTTSGTSAYTGSCGGSSAPEKIYKVTLGSASDLFVITHNASWDTVVYVRQACCDGTELACNDNLSATNNRSTVSLRNLAAGTYYVFIDGVGTSSGGFSVDIYGRAPTTQIGDTCANAIPILAGTTTGTTCSLTAQYSPAAGCTATADAADGVYWFQLFASTSVSFSTCSGTCVDTVLYVRTVCNTTAAQTACADNTCMDGTCGAPSMIQANVGPITLPAGMYYLIVDSRGTCGAYTITSTGIP